MAMYKGFSVTQERPPHNIVICRNEVGRWGHISLTKNSHGWIDLSEIEVFVCPNKSASIVNFTSTCMAFCNYLYDTVIPFKSEEEFHMALLTYPELFTDMRLLTNEEVFGA